MSNAYTNTVGTIASTARRIFGKVGYGSCIVGILVLTSCSQNQLNSLASKTPGTFISSADELRIGAEVHPKIVQQFGGIYEDDELNAYLSRITARLTKHSENPQIPYQVTILNSPTINAFAVPGGYIYLTRGMLALANNEAEIASVLAHELGHLTRRHSAKRHSVAVKANIVTRILQMAESDPDLKRSLNANAAGFLARHSREQEFEADRIAILAADKAGYDPYAAISFLQTMTEHDAFKNKLNHSSQTVGQINFFSTHPATQQRQSKALSFARQHNLKPNASQQQRNTYLGKIDGLRYGNNLDKGIVRGRTFIHPLLGFRFEVPPNFRIQNRTHLVVALDTNHNVMLFDVKPARPGVDLEELLGRHFGLGRNIWKINKLTLNGANAVSGTASYRDVDHQIYLIRGKGKRVYRFWFISAPDQTATLKSQFSATAQSFGGLSATDRRLAKPRKVRVVKVKPGDTVSGLSTRMAFRELRETRFRSLNSLSATAKLKAGQRVKIITN